MGHGFAAPFEACGNSLGRVSRERSTAERPILDYTGGVPGGAAAVGDPGKGRDHFEGGREA
jgi:hypothetical protein